MSMTLQEEQPLSQDAQCRQNANDELQIVTFHVDDLFLGVPIECVQEINRNLDTTIAPNAPEHIRGVINLRGDVVTVIDLRRVLGLPVAEVTLGSSNLIVRAANESIGLCVDRVADIINVPNDAITAPPANIAACQHDYFESVYRTDDGIIVIINVENVLAYE